MIPNIFQASRLILKYSASSRDSLIIQDTEHNHTTIAGVEQIEIEKIVENNFESSDLPAIILAFRQELNLLRYFKIFCYNQANNASFKNKNQKRRKGNPTVFRYFCDAASSTC